MAETEQIQNPQTQTQSKSIDMTGAQEVKGKNGVYLRKNVVNVADKIPEEFVGKYLRFDAKTGELFYAQNKPMSDAEKAERAKQRQAERAEKYAKAKAHNAQLNERIAAMEAEIKNLTVDINEKTKEMTSRIKKGEDTTALQSQISNVVERRTKVETDARARRAERKFVPKEFQ